MIVVRDHDFGISRGVPHGLVQNRHQQNEENQRKCEPGELLVGRARRLDWHGASLVRRAARATPALELSTSKSALGGEAASVDNPEAMTGPDDEVKAISETARDLALRQLDQQFQASDNLDTKALGVLGLDVAALAAILAGAKDVFQGRNWGYPAALILLSAALAMIAISTRRWSYGPKVAAFYGKATTTRPRSARPRPMPTLFQNWLTRRLARLRRLRRPCAGRRDYSRPLWVYWC